MDERFFHGFNKIYVEFHNILINGINCEGSSTNNIFYYWGQNSNPPNSEFLAQNIIIYDVITGTANVPIFNIWYTLNVTITDVIVKPNERNITKDQDNDELYLYFAYLDSTDYVLLKSIYISNYEIYNYFIYQDFTDIVYFDNITLFDISGNRLFYLWFCDYTYFENVNIDGNYGTLTNTIIRTQQSDYLDFVNCLFSSYIMDTNNYGVFYFGIGSDNIYLYNVTFENIESNGIFGLIYFPQTSNNIIIDNCLFRNNTNFIAMIQCEQSCDLIINNTVFDNNIANGICYGSDNNNVNNGILLNDDAGMYFCMFI